MNNKSNSIAKQSQEKADNGPVTLPVAYLKNSGHCALETVKSFGLFVGTGVKWLFANHPHKTWSALLALTVITSVSISISAIGAARMERNAYSKENAALLDSISRLQMEKVSYVTMENTQINPIPAK